MDFPLFCDPNREISAELDILDETNKNAKGLPMTVRSVYILKPERTIALMMTYPASTGRNFDEILRNLFFPIHVKCYKQKVNTIKTGFVLF